MSEENFAEKLFRQIADGKLTHTGGDGKTETTISNPEEEERIREVHNLLPTDKITPDPELKKRYGHILVPDDPESPLEKDTANTTLPPETNE